MINELAIPYTLTPIYDQMIDEASLDLNKYLCDRDFAIVMAWADLL